ncbi:hypothetical protein FACS1894177_06630 [Bacteroidia bacterium]|nr:hypothetical protein FACS1894177_06630 [Bacteroidia bacterium]
MSINLKKLDEFDMVVEPHIWTEEDDRIVSEHIRAHKAKQSPEEREYNRAFSEAFRAVSRLREAKKRWDAAVVAI